MEFRAKVKIRIWKILLISSVETELKITTEGKDNSRLLKSIIITCLQCLQDLFGTFTLDLNDIKWKF
jgi:hypothetical protein